MSYTMEQLHERIESALAEQLPQCRRSEAKLLDDALRYAVFPGGKRVRPVLSILGARIFRSDVTAAFPAACAVEFIHTSSLLFDDLPCMDDAQIRRGFPVVHVKFGEEVTILAAVALLNQAYALFGRTPALIREATACIGVDGMIAGQALDLAPHLPSAEDGVTCNDRLTERNRKTSAMMRLACNAGALACDVEPGDVRALSEAGQTLGEAFQMADDLLDARRSSQHTGKTAGQDRRHRRPSHGHLEEDACLHQLQLRVEDARNTLVAAYGQPRTAELRGFVDAMFRKLTSLPKAPLHQPMAAVNAPDAYSA